MPIRYTPTFRGALIATFMALLSACDASRDDSDGSCYTVSREGLRGLRPSLTIRYTLAQQQWPELKRVLTTFASKSGFEMLDLSVSKPELDVLELSLCNSKGITILTRQQVMNQRGEANEPLSMTTYLYRYRPILDWRPMGEALVEEFKRQPWQADAEWFQPRVEFGEPAE